MKSVKELITIGRQYFDNREYGRAAHYFHDVLKMGVKYADVLNMLGVIAHAQGKFASAIKYFRQALEVNPRYTEAILNLAVLYNDLGQYAEAKKLYSGLKRHSGKTFGQIEPVLRGKLSNLHADIGDIYRSIGLHNFAIAEYEKALNLNSDYFDIRTKLGQALRENGRLNDSLKEFRKILRVNSSYCPALIQQGITFYTMEKLPNAKKSWRTVLEKDADNKYAQMYIRLCDATAHAFKPVGKTVAKAKRRVVKKRSAGKSKRKSTR